jgi:hypothetical protein
VTGRNVCGEPSRRFKLGLQMVEVSSMPYSMKRLVLREAFRKRRNVVVRNVPYNTLTSFGHTVSNVARVCFTTDSDGDFRISIGCQHFNAVDTAKLRKWAYTERGSLRRALAKATKPKRPSRKSANDWV